MSKKISLDDIDLDDIFDFMERGDVNDAPEEVVEYLLLLDKVHKMHQRVLRFGNKHAIVKHLVLVDKMSPYLAEKIYNEMLVYFYSNSKLSKEVWRNIIFERMYNNTITAEVISQTPDDLYKTNKMWIETAKMKQLDVVDPPEIPKEAFARPNKVYAADAAFLGEEKINRLELARHIDEIENLSESERQILKQEAGIEPLKVFPDEQETSVRSKK